MAGQGRTVAEYLQSQGIDQLELRRQLVWTATWPKLAARYATPERIEAYLKLHRCELDGTELAVSHILLRPGSDNRPQAIEKLVQQARAIRADIVSGRISFAEAAGKYSAGPSASQQGRLGFIPRHGVMEEAFSRAAFALEVGQVSQPVVTRFGVHLIRCDAVKPGTRNRSSTARTSSKPSAGSSWIDWPNWSAAPRRWSSRARGRTSVPARGSW